MEVVLSLIALWYTELRIRRVRFKRIKKQITGLYACFVRESARGMLYSNTYLSLLNVHGLFQITFLI